MFGLFDGLSVANFAKLTDLSGGEDLARLLPDDLRVKLGSLSLDAMSLGLSAPGGAVSLDDVSITVGMPQIDMTVVPGFTIDALNATFDVADPLNRRSARSLNATLGGDLTLLGAPFDVMVTLPEVAAVARLTRPAAISLSSLFDEAGIGMPSDIGVGQLRVAELEVSADKAGAFGFATALAPAPGWSIDLGPVPLTVKDVTVVASRGSGTSSVAINGTIAFGTAFSLAGRYQSPGNFVFRGEIPSVRLSAIVATLTDDGLALPSGFDIDLEGTYARIEKAGADYSFQVATTMASLGTVVLEVRRTTARGGTWGIATGIDLTGLRLSRLPGLDGLKPFEDVFQLSELIVVVASFADPAFTFPALAAFQGPTLRTGNVNLPAQALGGGVIRGFNVSARWTLDASKQQTLLKNLLGLHASLDITLQVGADPAANSRLFVSMTTKIRNLDFACRFGGAIAGGQIELFLTGILQVPIQGRPTRFDLTLMFVANGAFLSGSMQGTLDFGDLKLSNLALVIGTDWEGLPSLGLAATLDIEGLDSSVAVFFDSTDPSRSLLAGSVSDITLKGVIDKFAGAVLPSTVDDVLDQIALEGTDPFRVPSSLAQSLDNLDLTAVAAALKTGGVTLATASQNTLVVALPGGGRWAVTDLVNMLHYDLSLQGSEIVVKLDPQIYLAPQQTMLGAITFPQGLFFNTGLRLLFLKAQAKVMVRPSQGLLIDGAMDKIVIGTETLFCVSSLDGKTGPVVSGATFAQPQLPEPRRSPHLIVDGSLDLLGIKRAVSVSVTKQGFLFTLKGSIASLLDADLDGTFTGLKALNIGGHLNVGLDTFDLGPLGKITITTGAGGEFRVGVVGEAIGAWFAGSFAFAGQTLTLPRFDLDTRTESLPKLAANVFDLVKTALLDFLKDAERWAKLVADGIISGVKDVEAVLRDTFHKSLDEAKKIVDEVSGKVKTCAMTTAASIL
ncbi:hypothetical protein [Methylobacterium frigidaeris]|uniref:Uncharacterized protein n=2 Tax=Methylobacterium frigidaeris TaxID=2038277 RepID=A0AA37M878_9HYPH|nr:hypothetical protein [Methylobacterium frigidaeris]GJD65844.1 hypothetical protein MPEAHAMD_6040 [Methylobacterium frigidaeris]